MSPVSTRPCAPRRTASKSFPARSKTRPSSAAARATSGDGALAPAPARPAMKRVARLARRPVRTCLISHQELGPQETLGAFAMLEGPATGTPRPRFAFLGSDVFSQFFERFS